MRGRNWVLALAGGAIAVLVAAMGTAQATTYTFTTFDVPGQGNPYGINAAGQIIGTFSDTTLRLHGFLYAGGRSTTKDAQARGCTRPWGTSNSGQVVGGFASREGRRCCLRDGCYDPAA